MVKLYVHISPIFSCWVTYNYVFTTYVGIQYCYTDDNGMFASVAFKSKRKNIPNNIDLYGASDSKYYFNDLEVSFACCEPKL